MERTREKGDALAELIKDASFEMLTDLVLELAARRPDVRRECIDFLMSRVPISEKIEERAEGEIVLTLWSELDPDLDDLDRYGGGDYGTVEFVDNLLHQVQERLDMGKVGRDHRREILDQALPYIESGNAGMDDMLYGVVFSACYDDSDFRLLATELEAMGNEWAKGQARGIYRQLGDRDKYLELRSARMEYGADYHDLATFYWEAGEKEKALQVAEKGLRKGKGRMDELRGFVADRAKESGDREKYLSLQFVQAVDRLTLQKYKAFKELCKGVEWGRFEPKLLEHINDAFRTEQLKIRMHREEYDEAISILIKDRYPQADWGGGDEIRIAENLEKRYPEDVLKYYLSGLGNLTVSATRKEYAHKAVVMAKVCRVMVEVIGDEERWKKFAGKVKSDNIRRPAFQDEFGKVVPDWLDLK